MLAERTPSLSISRRDNPVTLPPDQRLKASTVSTTSQSTSVHYKMLQKEPKRMQLKSIRGARVEKGNPQLAEEGNTIYSPAGGVLTALLLLKLHWQTCLVRYLGSL